VGERETHGLRVRIRGLLAVVLGCTFASASAVPAHASTVAAPARPAAPFRVGAAKADVTPSSLASFYLGGYGIGPMHKATAVLRHIYFRVIAIRGRHSG